MAILVENCKIFPPRVFYTPIEVGLKLDTGIGYRCWLSKN